MYLKTVFTMFTIFQIKNPYTATYFTNRALCYLKLKQWESAIQDCRRSLDLDKTLVKGHYFMGLALSEQSHHDEAISSLKRGKHISCLCDKGGIKHHFFNLIIKFSAIIFYYKSIASIT